MGYGLPKAAERVVLRVYDKWGQPQGAHALTSKALAEGVTLTLRSGLYQCVLVADGRVVARERLMITR